MNQFSKNALFFNLQDLWDDSDPESAPLLKETSQNPKEMEQIEKHFDFENISIFPFHHLIPLEKLAFAFSTLSTELKRPQTVEETEKRRQHFWEILAKQKIPANEALLLNDSIFCSFVDLIDEEFVEVDWELHLFDDIQGCAEFYLVEMFALKRNIFEQGKEVKTVIELLDFDILRHFSREQFSQFDKGDIQRLFLDNLIAAFSITISKTGKLSNRLSEIRKKPLKHKKPVNWSNIFNTYTTYGANRLENWASKKILSNEELAVPTSDAQLTNDCKDNCESCINSIDNDQTAYRLKLTNYWLKWQKDTHIAGFDFTLIEQLEDARSIRFYELTKLLRAQIKERDGKFPQKWEIEYEKLINLMPLPQMRFESEIETQIKNLIKPLKENYVKSFLLKFDWRGLNRSYTLIFRFKD